MIYITGDIHREQDIHKINPREFIVGETLTEEDYVIICGDFGCIWDGSTGDNFWLNLKAADKGGSMIRGLSCAGAVSGGRYHQE